MRTFFRFIAAAAVIAAVAACSQKPQFTVEGTIEGAQDSVLYLHHIGIAGATTVDSVRLAADGAFTFKAEAPASPEFYVLRIDNQIINISIDSTETVSVTARYPGMATNYAVSGSDNCERIRQLALKQQALQRRAIALERQLGREAFEDSLASLIEEYKRDVTTNYIYQGPDHTSSYFALFQTLGPVPIFNPHANKDDMRTFGAVATYWDNFYPESERAQNLRNITLKSMNEARTVRARQNQTLDAAKIVDMGVVELSLPDSKGQLRTLTELKGRVVLLDFHLFASSESAARILLLRELYNKYHDRGLEIYQVSIDQDEHFWKQQVAALPWITVRDAEGESLVKYNVQAVPEFFTIDRQNQLQKRSTQMGDLEAEIKALL